MNNKALIVFPKDSTTDFLKEIVIYLNHQVDQSRVTVLRIDASDESHKIALKEIENPAHDVILFLGHGTKTSLYGASLEQYRSEKFITSKNFTIFRDKRLILVSCDSSTLLKKNKASD